MFEPRDLVPIKLWVIDTFPLKAVIGQSTRGGIDRNDPRVLAACKPIAAYMRKIQPGFKVQVVSALLLTGNGGDRLVISTSNRYCLNKKGEHGESKVYYEVTRNEGWRQGCYCRKTPPGCINCYEYKSPYVKLTPHMTTQVFPLPKRKRTEDAEKRAPLDISSPMAVHAYLHALMSKKFKRWEHRWEGRDIPLFIYEPRETPEENQLANRVERDLQ